MPKTLKKSRLHSNKHTPKIKQEPKKLNQIYLQNYTHLNRNCYQETVSLNINSFFTL